MLGFFKPKVLIPLSVPKKAHKTYTQNILTATRNSGRMMLFAGDQKVEHLNEDFFGENIDASDANPEHLFQIASKAKIGAFATQLGLIDQYGKGYPDVSYIVKLNAKTNLIPTKKKDPISLEWESVSEVIEFKKQSKRNIIGVGYTLYIGSEYEAQMLTEAEKIILEAHQAGMLVVLWLYPRGKNVLHERTAEILAGAAGIGAALGADFIKMYPPLKNHPSTSSGHEMLDMDGVKQLIQAAGRTKVIFAGGEKEDEREFLENLYVLIHDGSAGGSATGRNIHQRSLADAISFANAITAITCEDKTVEHATALLKG